MTRFYNLFLIFLLFSGGVFAQTQQDTIFSYLTKTPVIIDGQATEDCWVNSEWHTIDQVWIPYNANMKEGDFEGRFKTAWDEEYLYVLVEVIDDSLSDDHSDPLQYWWDDDCLEIFIDENRSMGDHERNCNAFAYHVSLFYDAVDLNSLGQGVNYKDNIEVEMDTIAPNTYLWEFAIKNYDAGFNISNPEASRVYLSHKKLMGFAIAYCDNDETTSRENFIGSMVMPASNNNDMYKNADYFGPMFLIDQDQVTEAKQILYTERIKIFPVPAKDVLNIEIADKNNSVFIVTLSTLNGQLLRKKVIKGNFYEMDIKNLNAGIYIIQVQGNNKFFNSKIVLQ